MVIERIEAFSRTLSLLRQERKISQRKAAGELGVSQALLSHYENGVREPGLSFVVRAADYYGVSADFLLGRTMARDGGAILADDLMDSSAEKDNVLHGSAAALLSKKLLVNSTSLLYEQIGKEKAISRVVSEYLSLSFYKIYRMLYELDESADRKAFATPQACYAELCDAELKRCEAVLRQAIAAGEDATLDMSLQRMQQAWPRLSPSLLSLLHGIDEKIDPETEKK
ncbi:MAG: helix-turn-helix transcriptional regulator [Clostridia bacterium]|nr:helix-turn-helix transcriptional regulator [Clostridia bacterium]